MREDASCAPVCALMTLTLPLKSSNTCLCCVAALSSHKRVGQFGIHISAAGCRNGSQRHSAANAAGGSAAGGLQRYSCGEHALPVVYTSLALLQVPVNTSRLIAVGAGCSQMLHAVNRLLCYAGSRASRNR